MAVDILLSALPDNEATKRGLGWLMDRIDDRTYTNALPIGFYFAKLWYFERLYPISFTVAALRRAVREMASDEQRCP